MSEIDLLRLMKDTLVSFFDDLIDLLPEEPDLVIVRIFLKDRIPIMDVMNYIVNELLPLEEMVNSQDDKFFLEHNILFSKLDSKKVNHFKRIWLTGGLDKENKNTIWKWFKSFIYIAKKYKKLRVQSKE